MAIDLQYLQSFPEGSLNLPVPIAQLLSESLPKGRAMSDVMHGVGDVSNSYQEILVADALDIG
jgi:hypothetical protein